MEYKSRLKGYILRLMVDEILHTENEIIGLFLGRGHPKFQLDSFLIFLTKIDNHGDGYVRVLFLMRDDFVVLFWIEFNDGDMDQIYFSIMKSIFYIFLYHSDVGTCLC